MTDPADNHVDIERGVLELFRRALTRAVENKVDSPDAELDSIRRHKLVLAGIRHFGLEDHVTIQWYLDGDMLPNIPKQEDNVTIVTNAGYEQGPFPTEEEVYQFYTEELPSEFPTGEGLSEILNQDAFKWLEEYYQTKDIPFSDIYQTNLEIYLRLRHLQQYYDPDHPRESLPESTPEAIASEISEAATEMKRAMTRSILFQSLPPYVTEFDRISKQIITGTDLGNSPSQETNPNYKILISHLGSFYYNAIWKPIANRIGYYTAEAPSQEKLDETREYRVRDLKSTQATFFNELGKLRERADDFEIRLETRTERLPQINPNKSGLEEVLSLEMDQLSNRQGAES